MPSPSNTLGASPITSNSESFRVSARDLGENFEKSELHSHQGTMGKEVDGFREERMALVMVDKNKLEMKKGSEEIGKISGEEQEDGLAVLVKGWSSFSNVVRRRGSCEFTTCVSPCVKKATSHLKQLQEQIARWSMKKEQIQEFFKESVLSDDAVSTSGRCESVSTPSSNTRSLISEEMSDLGSVLSSPISDQISVFSDTQDSPLSKASPLQVNRSKATRSPLVKLSQFRSSQQVKPSVYQLGYAVVDEVIRLLGRLERDRLSTQRLLVQERQRVDRLGSEIDRLAFKRLTELPAAVQKEHESCTTDINELKWHCSYRGRLEARIKRRVDHAETQYTKFTEDVESSKRSCPLVQEKLDLESLAMESIQSKQDETDEELRQTLKRLEATERKTNEAKQRAAQERMLIKQDVDVRRNLLNEVSDELAQLKMNYTSNVHTISDIKNTSKENAEQCHNLEKREERVKMQEAAQQDKVVKLREKTAEQGSEHVRLIEENEKLRRDNKITEGDYQNAITKLKIEIKQYEIQVREITRKNKAAREDMDGTAKRIVKCKKHKISDKKSLLRAAREVEKIKQQNEVMNEEAEKLKILNHSFKTTKMRQDEEYFTEEDSLRSAESSLKNQLKEEAHIRTVLQARTASDTSDLLRLRVDSKKKKEKMYQQVVEAKKVVSHIQEQVSRLEKVHNERKQTISQMNEVLDKLSKQREEMESKYRAKIAELRPNEELAKQQKLELEQRIDQITWKSDMITKKRDDMASSTIMMTRVVASTQDDIAELEEDNKEIKVRLQASIDTEESLKEVLGDNKARSSMRAEEHRIHLEKRKLVLEETATLLDEKLAENKRLAENYQKLHSRFLQEKDAFFKNYETFVNEESHLKDHKELHSLQERMHECLQHYYNLRGLQNKSQVAQFKLNSKENNDKLCDLQQELSNVVTHINNFLERNNHAHQTISMEAAAMAQTPVR